MKKIGIIAAIVVVLVGGVFGGISYYEGRVSRSIKEAVTMLPSNWKVELGSVDYSLFGNNLVLDNFSMQIEGEQGTYIITASQIRAESLDASLIRSTMPGRLVKSLVCKNYSLTAPNGVVSTAESLEMTDITGAFGSIVDMIEAKAPAERILPVLYQIRASRMSGVNFVYIDKRQKMDTCNIASWEAKGVTALSMREGKFSDLKMFAQGRHVSSMADMSMAMDFTALANQYVPGQERELYSMLLNPRVFASFSIAGNKLVVEPQGNGSQGKLENFSFSYANNEQELNLQGKINHFVVTSNEPDGSKSIDVNLNLDCKLLDNEFNPVKINMDIVDLAQLDITGEIMGRMPASSKLRSLEAQYTDKGLIDVVLQSIANSNAITVEEARQQVQTQIKQSLSNAGNALMADIGKNLEKLIQKPGAMSMTVAPSQPLSSQQFSMYMLFDPAALNYNIQTN